VDNNSEVTQSNTTNDLSAAVPFTVQVATTQADLLPQSIAVTPATVTAGSMITVSYTVRNQGGTNAPASHTKIQIKNPSNVEVAAPVFSTSAINASSSVNESRTITIPSGSAAGTYNVFVIVDNNSEVTQSNTTNDLSAAVPFTVQAAGTPADLLPQSIAVTPATVTAGGTITVSYTVRNQGGTNAPASHTKIQIKNPSNVEVAAPVFSTSAINVGSSVNESRTVTIPSGSAAGTYNAYVIVDNNSEVAQSNTSNDYGAAVPFTVQTDATPAAPLPDHFSFSAISSHQVGVAFNITMTGRDAGGSIVQYSGPVSLSSTIGAISPFSMNLTAGIGTIAVTLDTAGRGVKLYASGGGATGASNSFDVTIGTPAVGRLSGLITLQSTGAPAVGATVTLAGAQGTSTTSSGQDGRFAFPNISSGQYAVMANDPATGYHSTTLNLQVVANATRWQPIVLSDCNPAGLTPVLLIPGILGSSFPEGIITPHLPKEGPAWDDAGWAPWTEAALGHNPGGLFEFGNSPGWRALVARLRLVNPRYKVGCTVFPVPYDWRQPVGKIAAHYLEPAIAHAKEVAGTNSVDIIAHSMGGLVTRTYIQGNSYQHDVSQFAMVGTPNHGAPFAYYLWQGSDPWNSAVSDSFYDRALGDLSSTLEDQPLVVCAPLGMQVECHLDRQRVFDLLHNHVRSVRDLLPTGEQALNPNGALSCEPTAEWTNQWLANLNESSSLSLLNGISFLYAGISDPVFHDTNTTLGTLAVGSRQCSQTFYPDGTPKIDQPKGPGDKTVPISSASLPGLGTPTTQDAVHKDLIFAHRDDLAALVAAGEPGTNLAGLSVDEEASGSTPGRELAVSLLGRTQLYLRAPDQTASGVVPESGVEIIGILGSQIYVRPDATAVTVPDPADGDYQITLSGSHYEDYLLRATYVDDLGNSTEIEGRRFFSGSASLTLTLEASGSPVLILNGAPAPPRGLQASIITATSKTRLSWFASTDSQVVGYNVYSRLANMPYFTLWTTTSGTSVDTSDPWAGDLAVALRIYAVSALYQDGSESFLSEQAENDDRDHDGLADAQEPALATDVNEPDSDHDGLNDGDEVGRGTNPLEADSDHDGYSDLSEVQNGGDALDPNRGPGLSFFAVTPCRLVDTRLTSPLPSGVDKPFQMTGACGVPLSARALSVNITVVGATGPGYVSLSPVKSQQISTSNVTFSAGQTRSNTAIVTLAPDGSGTAVAHALVSGGGQVGVVVDVSGYFDLEPSTTSLVGHWTGMIANHADSSIDIQEDAGAYSSTIIVAGEPPEPLANVVVTTTTFSATRPGDHNATIQLILQGIDGESCLGGEYIENGGSRPILVCRTT